MTPSLHPVAIHHLPFFVTAPGDTDVLMVVTAWFLIGAAVLFGIVFFKLHALPEHIAHGSHKLQFEIVAVLALLGLLTHNHAFWIAALLLALVDIPEFGGPLNRLVVSVEKIAGIEPGQGTAKVTSEKVAEQAARGNATAAARPDTVPASRELTNA
jgi:hypothetical protein